MELSGLGFIDDREQVAAHSIAHRLDYAEDGVGGDRGIYSVAAHFEDMSARRGGQGLAGGHDPELRGHHGAGLRAARFRLRFLLSGQWNSQQ